MFFSTVLDRSGWEGTGRPTRVFPAIVAYNQDPQTGDIPGNGNVWGVQAGSWYLEKAGSGFRVVGAGGDNQLCVVVPATVTPAGIGASTMTVASTAAISPATDITAFMATELDFSCGTGLTASVTGSVMTVNATYATPAVPGTVSTTYQYFAGLKGFYQGILSPFMQFYTTGYTDPYIELSSSYLTVGSGTSSTAGNIVIQPDNSLFAYGAQIFIAVSGQGWTGVSSSAHIVLEASGGIVGGGGGAFWIAMLDVPDASGCLVEITGGLYVSAGVNTLASSLVIPASPTPGVAAAVIDSASFPCTQDGAGGSDWGVYFGTSRANYPVASYVDFYFYGYTWAFNGTTPVQCASPGTTTSYAYPSSITVTSGIVTAVTAGSAPLSAITVGTTAIGSSNSYGLLYTNPSGILSSVATPSVTGQLLLSGSIGWATMSGDATIAAGGALTIAANAVTYAKMQTMSASTLLGNPTGSSAAPSEITLGSGLSFSGTTLVATGGGGGSGTVTSITAGTGLTGGTITSTGTIALSVPVSIADGGTNSTTTLTNNQVMVSSSGSIVELGAMTNGQLVIGHTSNAPSIATLTAGTGIAITNGAGSITIAASGGGAYYQTMQYQGGAAATQEPILEWDPDIFVLTDDPTNTATSVTVTSNVALLGSALTGNEVVVSNAGGTALVELGAMTNGQLVIGHTSNAPSIATLTAGTGIAITNGAGSITIAARQRGRHGRWPADQPRNHVLLLACQRHGLEFRRGGQHNLHGAILSQLHGQYRRDEIQFYRPGQPHRRIWAIWVFRLAQRNGRPGGVRRHHARPVHRQRLWAPPDQPERHQRFQRRDRAIDLGERDQHPNQHDRPRELCPGPGVRCWPNELVVRAGPLGVPT